MKKYILISLFVLIACLSISADLTKPAGLSGTVIGNYLGFVSGSKTYFAEQDTTTDGKVVGSYLGFIVGGKTYYAKPDTSFGGSNLLGSVAAGNFTTTSASFVDITGLSVSVAANTTYFFTLELFANPGLGGTGTIQFVFPSGTTFILNGNQINQPSTLSQLMNIIQTTTFTQGSNLIYQYVLHGVLTTSSTAGVFKMQTEDTGGYTETIYAGSCISLIK